MQSERCHRPRTSSVHKTGGIALSKADKAAPNCVLAVDWVNWSEPGTSNWAGLDIHWLARDQGWADGSRCETLGQEL